MSKVKKFSELDELVEPVEKLSGEYEIDSILDIIKDEDIDDFLSKNEAYTTINNTNMVTKEIKRGEFIWLSALIRPKDKEYMTPTPAVLKLKVVDIFKGLKYLNKIMK